MFGFWSALRLLTLPSPLLAAGTRGLVQMLVGDMQQLHLTLGTGWLRALLVPDGPATTSTQPSCFSSILAATELTRR